MRLLILTLSMIFQVAFIHAQDKAFRYVDQMPEAPYNIKQYLADSLRYPQLAIDAHAEGRVVVEFIVDEGGKITELKKIGTKTLGFGMDQEALRVVAAMPSWKPGMQEGKPVKVYFTLPVIFKLPASAGVPHVLLSKNDIDSFSNDSVFHYVEHMPEAPFEINEYLAKNLRYPKEAVNNNVQGRIAVIFVIEKDGMITNVNTLGDTTAYTYGLREEAMRVISKMPRWKPGAQNGRPVKVYFTLPITFRLDNSDDR